MGKKDSDTPPAPDYRGAAEATGKADMAALMQQTYANRPNQYTPFGSQTWKPQKVRDPSTGKMVTKWTQSTKLTGDAQKALDAQLAMQSGRSQVGLGMMGRLESEFGQEMPWSQFGDFQGLGVDPSELRQQFGGMQMMDPSQLRQQFGGTGGIDPSGLRQQFGGLGDVDPNAMRQKAEDAAYGRSTSRLDPRFEQSEEAMEVQLRNQGLRPGDQAYDTAKSNFERSRTDAYEQAQRGAVGEGRTEAAQAFGQQMQLGERGRAEAGQMFGQQFGLGQEGRAEAGQMFGQQMGMGQQGRAETGQAFDQQMQSSQYANQIRQSQMSEEMQKRGFSLNEINAIMSGQQVNMPSMPGFQSAGRGQGTDYTTAAHLGGQYGLDAASIQQAKDQSGLEAISSIIGSGAGLGMAGMMFCDRRLKDCITRVGEFLGYPLYKFRYIWDEWAFGVMADEVNPEAVTLDKYGFSLVNYDLIKPKEV